MSLFVSRNVIVKDFLALVMPFIEMLIWFGGLSLLGAFSSSMTVLAAFLVLLSPVIDHYIWLLLKWCRKRMCEHTTTR